MIWSFLLWAAACLLTTGQTREAESVSRSTTQPFDRPMIFSINPAGNGDFVGAPRKGSDFVRYDELLFQRASEAGSRSARVLASWREVEAEKGKWDWSHLDREMELCRKYHIEPVVLICNIPAWVSPTGKPAHDHPPKDENAGDFTNFITRMTERYKDKARYYEFWNEQNGCSWINKDCDNARMAHTYLPWLQRCYKAIKAVDANPMVAIGGLDDVQGHAPIFLEQCYKLRVEQYKGEKLWDAIAEHPYNSKATDTIDAITRKLDAIRAIAARYGDAGIPIWITEYGWNAAEMSLEVQRQGTIDFLKFFQEPAQIDVIIAQQLAVADFESAHLGYGLCDLNLRPRPSFQEFQRLARSETPCPISLGYRIQPDGTLQIDGTLVSLDLPEDPPTQVEIYNEEGVRVASAEAPPNIFKSSFPNLKRDLPLLATISPLTRGHREQPVARVPLISPQDRVPNAGFESLFRAGIPWAWSTDGQAVCCDGGSVGPEHRRSGEHALMLVLFDNARLRCFDERLEVPVRAARGEKFTAGCQARYSGPDGGGDVLVLLSANLVDPEAQDRTPRRSGAPIGRQWSRFAMEVTAPCDAPLLRIQAVSENLGRGRWLLSIDDVSLTPVGSQPAASRP